MARLETIEQQVDKASRELGLTDVLRKLDPAHAQQVRRDFIETCCTGNSTMFYWDHFRPPEVHFPDDAGWKKLQTWAPEGEETCYLLFNEADDTSIYDVSLEHVASLISECYPFEFYLVGKQFDWAASFSHHQAVALQGKAARGT